MSAIVAQPDATDVENIDRCPACDRVGLWWIDREANRYHCLECYRQGRATGPDAAHIAVHRQEARMMSNEELHSRRSDAEWLVTLADLDDEYPAYINAHSQLNSLAIMAAVDAELAWRERKGISKPATSLGWPKAFLDDLKARVSIESQVAQTVTLRRQGASLEGICPFHNDRNPSLVVWPDSGRFKCFGCQLSGDVIAWAQAANRMEFRQAVHMLAAYAGVDMPRKTKVQTVIRERGRS